MISYGLEDKISPCLLIACISDWRWSTAPVQSLSEGELFGYTSELSTADGGYNPSLICVTAGAASSALQIGAWRWECGIWIFL